MPPEIKLHLGCGTNKKEGWVNVDSVVDCQPDLLHDLTKPLPYADGSVHEILAEDLLEHFDKYMRYVVFSEWARVLKMGGKVTVQVPDFKKLLYRYFKFGFEKVVDLTFGENMWRSEIYLCHYGNHKWGYSEDSLKEFVKDFGINVVSLKKTGLNLRMVGEKTRHILLEDLDGIKVYSNANASGVGHACLPLGVIRKQIKVFHNQEHTDHLKETSNVYL